MSAVRFLSLEDVLAIHERMIVEFGGDRGIRARGLLSSAVSMPGAMFSGSYLHVGLPAMAGAYHFHLCTNHPFVDGNKRVAVAAAEVFLLLNKHELCATDKQVETLTMDLAMSKITKEQVVEFFQGNVRKK